MLILKCNQVKLRGFGFVNMKNPVLSEDLVPPSFLFPCLAGNREGSEQVFWLIPNCDFTLRENTGSPDCKPLGLCHLLCLDSPERTDCPK